MCPARIAISHLEIPEGIESLHKVTLPPTITELYSSTFADCENLKSLILPEGLVTLIGSVYFDDTFISEITYPSSLTTLDSQGYAHRGTAPIFTVAEGSYMHELLIKRGVSFQLAGQ